MASLGDILRRFRFHGVPGAPTAVGVPADRTAELEGELSPVFATLEGVQRRTAELETTAEHDARQRRAAAVEEGRQLIARARAGAAGARAQAVDARLALAEAECHEVLAAGQAEAQRIRGLAAERTDAVVELVVTQVLAVAPRDTRS